jgi:hypothetical protein
MAFENLSPGSPKIDLYAAKRLLAGRLMQNTTQGLFFRDGYGLTEDFTQDVMAAQVRILRHQRPTLKSRTMAEGSTPATTNSGHFNVLDPEQPRTKEYKLDLLEVYDQNVDIADVLEQMIGVGALNLEAQGIEDQLTRLINAYTFAAQIAAALNEDAAAGIAGGTPGSYAAADGTLIRLGSGDVLTSKFFEAHSALDDGSIDDSIDTFKHDGRVAVFTPEAKFQLVTAEKTVFEIGSSRAVQLLEIGSAGGLETRPETNVTGYFGHLNSTPLHMVSKPIWALVEEYLGLDAGTLVDNVLGMVVASEATGRGIAFQNSIKIIDNPRGQGYRLQPLTRWGVEVFIPAGIKLIVKDSFVNPAVDTENTPDVVDPVGIVGFNIVPS